MLVSRFCLHPNITSHVLGPEIQRCFAQSSSSELMFQAKLFPRKAVLLETYIFRVLHFTCVTWPLTYLSYTLSVTQVSLLYNEKLELDNL